MEKAKEIFGTILTLIILLLAFLFYPWIISVDKNGKTTCSNILGLKMKC